MQDGSRKYDIERASANGRRSENSSTTSIGSPLPPLAPGSRGTDDGAGIRLQRRDRKSFARERITGDAAAGTDVERPACAAVQQSVKPPAIRRCEIALCRRDQRVVIKRIENKLPRSG